MQVGPDLVRWGNQLDRLPDRARARVDWQDTSRLFPTRRPPEQAARARKRSVAARVGHCDETLRGKRDRALLLFAWATGGRRRSEPAGATLENLWRVDANSYVHALTHSKINQSGQGRPEDIKLLVEVAALTMRAWLAASGIKRRRT
ncbi:hypothetical protein WKW79_32950 [Variovorax robiniae]|uniref:Tyr recombinase domain-containing protein n=1 Tax=Variovorax robiniae TaxID=1836199 RepID=A0ABU8XK93_9BURK